MIYGLYRSATGVAAATYKQSVLSNNLANSETKGFKRDFVMTQQRPVAAQELPGKASFSSRFYDLLGGGTLLSPTATDYSRGVIESTGNPMDVSVSGKGYIPVSHNGETFLTRNGNFTIDNQGSLILADGSYAKVLDEKLKPITLDPNLRGSTIVTTSGEILQKGALAGKVGLRTADSSQLEKREQQLFAVKGGGASALKPDEVSSFRPATLEGSNVDTPTEIVEIIETQRLIEANANMIRFQDQTLGRLVTDVGKI